MFLEQANNIVGWQKIPSQELMDQYLLHKDDLIGNYYMSALVCRYWSDVLRLYWKNCKNASKEDCYDWLVDSIMTVLKYKPWKNKHSKLYGDAKAVDRSIRSSLKTNKNAFYVYREFDKRKVNSNTVSVDEEEVLCSFHAPNLVVDVIEDWFSLPSMLIQKYYSEEKYFELLFVAVSCYNNGCNSTVAMLNINSNFCKLIENQYRLQAGKLCEYYSSVFSKYSRYQVDNRIKKIIPKIQRDALAFNEV